MELEDLENRIKELDKSIFEMKELIERNKTEVNQFVQKKNDENNRTATAIVENQGRQKELQKLIEELKTEEESTSGSEQQQ